MPDNDTLPDDLEKLIQRYTERGIAIPALRRLVRELLKLGLPTPQIETAIAQRLAQVGGSSLPAPNIQAMRQALLPTEAGAGWPILRGAGLVGLGGLLMGGSTPAPPGGVQYGTQYFQTYGEPAPEIGGRAAGTPEEIARRENIQSILNPPKPPPYAHPAERTPPPARRLPPDRLPYIRELPPDRLPYFRNGAAPPTPPVQKARRTTRPSTLFRRKAR